MAPPGRSRLLLNGEWQFCPAPDGAIPTTNWQEIRVPHRSREFEDDPPDSGWYRTKLEVPSHWPADSPIGLDLGRVRHFGRAYLDGQILAEHYHMRQPWRLDLNGQIRPGDSGELVVYTHSCSGAYAHPTAKSLSAAATAALDTRFWHTSAATIGMEGDVWLYCQPQVYLEDLYLLTSVRAKTLTVEATITNHSAAAFAGQVQWAVSRDGTTVLALPDCPVEVEPGAATTVRAQVAWPDPVLWGRPPYGVPVLYFLRAQLVEDSTQLDEVDCRFGFREVWAEGDRLLLNGEVLMPWGDHTIPYVYERQWLTRKFADLAAANISIVEHHRYDPPPVFYQVADEMGIFVVGANFCVGTGQVPPPDLAPEEMDLVMESHLAVADTWLRWARNHPSILFWDITDARDPAFCVPLLRKVKELDRSRIAEVTFDPDLANPELVELIDCYRLFSSLSQIEATLERIDSDPALPTKPVRIGEAGIFAGAHWPASAEPPLQEGWGDFLQGLAERNIHGLQTFHLADMDYRGFPDQVPNNLGAPVHPQISWPSQSGQDARIAPLGDNHQAAWGKTALYLNWCDPTEVVSRPTATSQWSRALFRRWAGRDVGPLAQKRAPEVIVQVVCAGRPVAEALVFVEGRAGQGGSAYGVRADRRGTSWFVLSEPGLYRFSCGSAATEVEAVCQPVAAPPGYGHIQQIHLEVEGC